MNDSTKIAVRLSGPDESSPVLLSDFSGVCSTLRSSLRHVERCVSGIEDEIQYEITELSEGSACLALAPKRNSKIAESAQAEVVRIFRDTIQLLEGSDQVDRMVNVDSRIDYAALKSLEGFFSAVRRGLSLSLGGVTLSRRFVEAVKNLVEPSIASLGSVKGRLETLDLHNHNNFVLYLPNRERVTCVFDADKLDSVIGALQRKVTARGMLHYSPTKAFPVKVEVDSFVIEPEDEQLLSLISARGALRRGRREDSVRRVRKMRDEWE